MGRDRRTRIGWLLAAAVVAPVLLLAACGGDDEGAEGTGASTPASTPGELAACLDAAGYSEDPFALEVVSASVMSDPVPGLIGEVDLSGWPAPDASAAFVTASFFEEAAQAQETVDAASHGDRERVTDRVAVRRSDTPASVQIADGMLAAVKGCLELGEAGAESIAAAADAPGEEPDPGTPDQLIGCLEEGGYEPEPWESEGLTGELGAVVVSDGAATAFATFFERASQAEEFASPEEERDEDGELEVIRGVLGERVAVWVYGPEADTVPALTSAIEACIEGDGVEVPSAEDRGSEPAGPVATTPGELIDCLEAAGHRASRQSAEAAAPGEQGTVQAKVGGDNVVIAIFFDRDSRAEEHSEVVRPFYEGATGSGGTEVMGGNVVVAHARSGAGEMLDAFRRCLEG